MRRQPRIIRLVHALPATTIAIVLGLVLFVATAWNAANDASDQGVADIVWPLLVLMAALILVGLFVDGSRISGRPGVWDEVVPMSATDFERLAVRHFAELGWAAQRDEPDFKLFVRNRGSRPSVASITVDPVVGGTHVRMTLSREASDGERLMREARSSALLVGGKPDRIPPGYRD